ncbi:MAG TPA: PAS domain S-box protein [Bacteroidia bacterium]
MKILIVEDSPVDAALIKDELERGNISFDSMVVDDKAAYEKALDEFHPDVILSDHRLPRFSSMEALSISHSNNPHLPFILVTGAVSEEFAVESLKAGADDYVLKSSLQRLPQAINHALEKRRSETEAENTLEHYKMILGMMPVGCIIVDENSLFTYWNPAAERIFGYLSGEMAGKSPFDTITHPEMKNNLHKKVEDIRNGKMFAENTARNIRKDGKTIICEWRNSRLTDSRGKFIGILSTCVDVTEKFEAEKEILKFASLVESSTEFIAMSGLDGNVVYVNRAGCELVGLDKNDVRIRKLCEFFEEDEMNKLVGEVIPSLVNKGNWTGEFRFVDFISGRSFPVYLFGYVIRDPQSQEPMALAIVAHDITRQKESEMKIKKSEEQLHIALSELNTFIYRASHDLKGPLSSIVGLTSLASQEIKDEVSKKYVDMIRESTTRLSGILHSLIETMKVREGTPVSELIDFHALVGDILKRFRYAEGFEKIQVRVEITAKNHFYSFHSIINSILQNLVENAIKYHNYALAYPFITISVFDHGNGVQIVVEDNGHGMSEEVQRHIFEMYYRGNEDSKGSGLGLYIVNTAIKRINGTISVSSKEGNGTKFTVFIPSVKS